MKRSFVLILTIAIFAGLAAAQGAAPPAPPAPAGNQFLAQPSAAPEPPEPAMGQEQPAPPAPPAPGAPMPPPLPNNWYAPGKGSYLGIGVQEIDPERAKQLKLAEPHGVEVTAVSEESPAAKAGLKSGDVVIEFNGQPVEGVEQFVRLVRETPPGHQAKLLVDRNGATQTLTVTVGNRKNFQMDPKFAQEMDKMGEEMRKQFGPDSKFNQDMKSQFGPDSQFQHDMQKLRDDMQHMHFEMRMPDLPEGPLGWKSRMLGVESEAVSSQLGEYFGVKQGALVRSVVAGSAAEKAGIKAGDVIVKVGSAEVGGPREITQAMRQAAPDKPVPVTVVRNKKTLTLSVTPETGRKSGN